MQGGSDISVAHADAGSSAGGEQQSESAQPSTGPGSVQLQSREWCGRYALPAGEFTAESVGAKSLNTIKLQVRCHGQQHTYKDS